MVGAAPCGRPVQMKKGNHTGLPQRLKPAGGVHAGEFSGGAGGEEEGEGEKIIRPNCACFTPIREIMLGHRAALFLFAAGGGMEGIRGADGEGWM